MRDLSGDNAVDLAVLRLERAVSLLEARLGDVMSAAQPNSSGLFDEDRSRLAAELDASRAREQALTEAGRQASAALGKAIVGIKSALTEEVDLFFEPDGPSGHGGLIMAQITIDINGKPYVVGCEDGQEAHLTEIAGVFDQQVRQIAGEVGTLTEARLFLMAALMMADDLTDTRNRLVKAQGEAARYAADIHRIEQNSTKALDNAARKIEALVHRAVGSAEPA